MKFDYVIHITRNGERKYTAQLQDKGGDTPFTSQPTDPMDWNTLFNVLKHGIESRENKKVAEFRAAAAKPSEPKDWVPTASGQPVAAQASLPIPPAKEPAKAKYIKTPAAGAGASTNPNPAP